MNYREFNDYELLYMVKEKDEESYQILHNKYEPLIYRKSTEINKRLKSNGVEIQDLMQEGRLALSQAIKNYNDENNEFITFAHTCIENQILHLNRTLNSNKNKALNYAMENNTTIINKGIDLENLYIENKDSINSINLEEIKEILNKEEYYILLLKIYGYKVEEISKVLNLKDRHISYKYNVIKKKLESINK